MKFTSILRLGAGLRRLAAGLLITITAAVRAEDIVWNFGTAAPGSGAPLSTPVNLTVSDLLRGNFNAPEPPTEERPMLAESSASSGYAGSSGSYNAGTAAKRSDNFDPGVSGYFELTLTPAANYRVSLTGINFGARRTNTGPTDYSIRTSADNFAAPVASAAIADNWGLNIQSGLTLTSLAPLTLRIYGHGYDHASSPPRNTINWRIDDLKLSVFIAEVGAPAPAITGVSPLSGTVSTAVTITGSDFGATPAVRFNGTLAAGSTVNPEGNSITVNVPAGATSGPVTVTTSGGAATSPQPFDVIPLPNLTVQVSPGTFPENAAAPAASGTVSVRTAPATNLLVALTSSDPAAATVSPGFILIPAGETTSAPFSVNAVANPASFANATSTITATADGYDQGIFNVTVTNTDPLPTTVVVNKFLNVGDEGEGDTVELLVIGDGTAGSTADMRRMLLKDYTSGMSNDGGGRYRFNDIAFFSAVKAGTLLVITDNASTTDIDSADFVLRLGLLDTAYFTEEAPLGNSFNIASPEMIMIKSPGAAADGETGAIHSLAVGPPGSRFTNAPPKKLLATGASVTGRGVIANNSTSTVADYDGTDATGDVTAAAMSFGQANNNANNAYIRALRGFTGVDGAGLAGITNGDASSPLFGKNYFPRNTPAQTVAINLISNAGPGTVTSVKISVPAAWGAPVEANVAVTGAGAGTPALSVTGQDITITGTAITVTEAADIILSGLAAPNPAALTDDGRYAFAIQSAGDSGVLTELTAQPSALVSIPVASLRDVDTNGVALDLGKTVAISAVCTEENFNTSGTSGYVQDGDSGINVFISGVNLALSRGTRYAIVGQIIQFQGLTEISPAGAANVIALGPDTEPAPLTITVPDLMSNAEAYEGRLIKVVALNHAGGNWAAGQTVNAADASANPLNVRIQAGSTALTAPNWPATITGIFGQFDSSSPFTTGYQIMPRTDADVQSLGTGDGYGNWAASYPGIGGPEEDADFDGASNLLEYAGGSVPDNGASLPQHLQTVLGPTLTVTWAKGTQAASDPALTWTIEATTDLAAGPWTTNDVLNVHDIAGSISGDYILQPGVPKAWLRLKITRAK